MGSWATILQKTHAIRIGFVIFILYLLYHWFWRHPVGNRPDFYARKALEPLDETDVTLGVHLTLDRTGALNRILKLWPGPVAVAFYLRDLLEDSISFDEIRTGLLEPHGRVEFIVVYSSDQAKYPVNMLRNRVLSLVRTNLVLLLDVDFIPSDGLYDYIKANIATLNAQSRGAVFAIAPFDHRSDSEPHPRTQSEVTLTTTFSCIARVLSSLSRGVICPILVCFSPPKSSFYCVVRLLCVRGSCWRSGSAASLSPCWRAWMHCRTFAPHSMSDGATHSHHTRLHTRYARTYAIERAAGVCGVCDLFVLVCLILE